MKLIVRLEIRKPFDCQPPGGATYQQQYSRVVIRHSMSICDFVTVCTKDTLLPRSSAAAPLPLNEWRSLINIAEWHLLLVACM